MTAVLCLSESRWRNRIRFAENCRRWWAAITQVSPGSFL